MRELQASAAEDEPSLSVEKAAKRLLALGGCA
jgi:hypothetical protein